MTTLYDCSISAGEEEDKPVGLGPAVELSDHQGAVGGPHWAGEGGRSSSHVFGEPGAALMTRDSTNSHTLLGTGD